MRWSSTTRRTPPPSGSAPLDLTFKEFELLKYLAQHPGRVFTRDQLLQEVWGYDYFGGTRTVDVHVRRLRAKLGPEHETLIGTVRNVGYRFVLPTKEPVGRAPVGRALLVGRACRDHGAHALSVVRVDPTTPSTRSRSWRPYAVRPRPPTAPTRSTRPGGWRWPTPGSTVPRSGSTATTASRCCAATDSTWRSRPDARGSGIGTALAQAALAEAPGEVTAWTHVDHPAARAIAERLGFAATRELWVMGRDAGRSTCPPSTGSPSAATGPTTPTRSSA